MDRVLRLTFSQFQETKQALTPTEAHSKLGELFDDKAVIYLYVDELYLYEQDGKYYLQLEHDYASDSMLELEMRLYEFADGDYFQSDMGSARMIGEKLRGLSLPSLNVIMYQYQNELYIGDDDVDRLPDTYFKNITDDDHGKIWGEWKYDVDSRMSFAPEEFTDEEEAGIKATAQHIRTHGSITLGERVDGIETKRLAGQFAANLKAALTFDAIKAIVDENRRNQAPDLCATHDHCDANVYMSDAFVQVMGEELDVNNEAHTKLVNEAWTIAKEAHFYTGL